MGDEPQGGSKAGAGLVGTGGPRRLAAATQLRWARGPGARLRGCEAALGNGDVERRLEAEVHDAGVDGLELLRAGEELGKEGPAALVWRSGSAVEKRVPRLRVDEVLVLRFPSAPPPAPRARLWRGEGEEETIPVPGQSSRMCAARRCSAMCSAWCDCRHRLRRHRGLLRVGDCTNRFIWPLLATNAGRGS